MTKLTAYTICFVATVLWAMVERHYGIEIIDQLIMATFFGVLVIMDKGY